MHILLVTVGTVVKLRLIGGSRRRPRPRRPTKDPQCGRRERGLTCSANASQKYLSLFFSLLHPLHHYDNALPSLPPPTPSVVSSPPSEYTNTMARGNQRDKAREANLKKQAGQVCLSHAAIVTPTTGSDGQDARHTHHLPDANECLLLQKKANTMSGTEMQRAKESAADIMRAKQAAAEAKKNEAAKK
ncbi:hypothetical protein NQ176_g10606 [Zarea fungicola]|uniref:Uncharacterized protein n=1 Tax=Zarea fungicola TaxID=93591 RepID=A0ACC1MGR3_9HYPO|nr:hypothetical protein NQ176_g10606 [Lecanicillium fungicola]